MAKATVDLLGELYGWDTKIDDVFALDAANPERDEDDALDAYEEVIGVASQPQQDGADAVLSLAAQLLAKHFYKFPHVHLNVVDVMLALCGVERQHAVRINTIRSLLQIVKTPASEAKPMARECFDRVREVLAKLVAKETSGVIMRHMTQLTTALKEREEVAAAAAKKEDKLAKKQKKRAENNATALVAVEKETSKPKPSPRAQQQPVLQDPLPSSKEHVEREQRQPRGEHTDGYTPKGKYDDRRSKDESGPSRKDDGDRKQKKQERSDEAPARTLDAPARDPPQGGFQGHGCPPGPYLFIGNVPFDIRNSDISDFLSEVDPTMRSNNVQIKYPPRGGSGYAFVSLPSTELAREAMRFVNKVKFQGRYLNSNFARGPPCDTLAFVERRKGGNMEDDDAVREFNFAKCHPNVWERLCDILRTYGDLDVVEVGKVRFRDVESAKDVIKKHHYIVQGYEIIPIYEPEEQLRNDNTRPRHVQQSNTTRQGFALKSGRVVGDVGDKHSDDRGRNGDRKSDKHNNRNNQHREEDQGKGQRKRSDSPKKHVKHQDAPSSGKPKQSRDRSLSRSQSPVVAPSRKQAANNNRARSKSRSPSPAPVRKEDTRENRSKKSQSPARASRKQDVETRGRSKSRSSSPPPVPFSGKKESRSCPRSPRKQEARSASRSPARASNDNQKVSSQNKQQADRFHSRSPVDDRQATHFENRGGDQGDRGHKSRSRSGERSHFNGRDIRDVSSYGPGRRGGDGGNGGRFERDQAPRTHDQGSEHSRPERRESGAWSSGGGMARYGPTGNDRKGDSRDDKRNDRAIGNREYRESPQPQRQSFNNNQHDRNDRQRRRSRSPPRHRGVEVGQSQSPQGRRPVDDPPRRGPGGDNVFRGGRDTRMLERKGSNASSISRRDDDRSIAEIAREAQEKQRQMQQMRREQQSGGGYYRHGDGGRTSDHYSMPPSRDHRASLGNGAVFQRNRSRSPVRSAQPQSHQSRRNDLPRERLPSPPRQTQSREFNRGNGARGSPQFDRPQERRDSSDISRTERRGRSPPPSPFMKSGNRRAPSPLAMERSRGHNLHGRDDDRDRKRDRHSRRDGHDRSQKEQNRNVANSQRSNERSNRDRPAPVLDSPPVGKRLRSLTPSPVRRDNNSYWKPEERSRSPILKRSIDRDDGNVPEKKRRVMEDDDDRIVLPKSTSAVFDDMDETMVDYDEDED